jgi:peptidoglycan hydrolase CwlO-like protein
MPKKIILSFFLLVFFIFSIGIKNALGDELDDINKQLNELTQALNQSKAATTPLEQQVNSIRGRISFIETDLVRKKNDIDKGYKELEKQTEELNLAIRNYYIKSYYNSPILIFLSSNTASEITQVLAYQKAAADQDKRIITNIALSISSLEERKASLESEQSKLSVTKANLDKVIADAKKYQGELSGKIAFCQTARNYKCEVWKFYSYNRRQ